MILYITLIALTPALIYLGIASVAHVGQSGKKLWINKQKINNTEVVNTYTFKGDFTLWVGCHIQPDIMEYVYSWPYVI